MTLIAFLNARSELINMLNDINYSWIDIIFQLAALPHIEFVCRSECARSTQSSGD